MSEKYFDKFQKITYANNTVRNLLSRVVISQTAKYSPYTYYDYTIINDQRPDYIAEKYYQDAYASWIIYMSNGVVDPYYDWKLSQDTLNSYLIDKYGSIEISQQKILFFRSNWYEDERRIDKAAYDLLDVGVVMNGTVIPVDLKKYWRPVFDNFEKIIYYERKPEELISTTNYVVTYGVNASNTGTSYTAGELAKVYDSSNVNLIGTGEVVYSNSTVVTLKNNLSTASITTGMNINGLSSGYTQSITVANTTPIWSINQGEYTYWAPVYAYDYETEKNSDKNTVKVLDKSLYNSVTKNLKAELS